jgi:hypothetical protein
VGCYTGPGADKRDAGRTRALSGPTHFGPKSVTEMGACGQDRTPMSVCVGPLGCDSPIFLSARTHSDLGGQMGRPEMPLKWH